MQGGQAAGLAVHICKRRKSCACFDCTRRLRRSLRRWGFLPERDFRITTGHCGDCAAIPQALWYFAAETIAAPRAGHTVAGFTRGVSAWEDLRQWGAAHGVPAPIETPALVWIGSPHRVAPGKARRRWRDA